MFNAQDFAARLVKREDHWLLLKDFVAEWHGPLKRGDGYPASELDAAEKRLGLKLPLALREWYQLAGRREDVFAAQNFLVSPDELAISDDLLEIYSENQGVVWWGIKPEDLHLPDPPVYLNDDELHEGPRELIQENDTVSEFALQMTICELLVSRCFPSGSLTISTELNTEAIERVKQGLTNLGFPDWHWPSDPARFYGAEDTLALTLENNSIYLAANTQNAFAQAEQLLKPQ